MSTQLETEINNYLQSLEDGDKSNYKFKTRSEITAWKKMEPKRLIPFYFNDVCKLNYKNNQDKCDFARKILYGDDKLFGPIMGIMMRNKRAIVRKFEELYNIPLLDCHSLFIDENQRFLAALPDKLIEHDGIVKIKPLNDKDFNVENTTFEAETSSSLEYDNDKYYFQIQGQLHITKRNYCTYIYHQDGRIKIKKIMRDDTFWVEKMSGIVENFYKMYLLPEIVDPEYELRSMN